MELFSKQVLEKWKEVDPTGWHGIAMDILDAFTKTALPQLDAFRKALLSRDKSLSYLHSHSLKSCYGNVGALLIQAQFTTIEKSIEATNWRQAELAFKTVELNLSETHRLIEEYKSCLAKN